MKSVNWLHSPIRSIFNNDELQVVMGCDVVKVCCYKVMNDTQQRFLFPIEASETYQGVSVLYPLAPLLFLPLEA
ncbi:hypothetical protein GCM10026983_36640 [Gracilibacillus alcaliphilus]